MHTSYNAKLQIMFSESIGYILFVLKVYPQNLAKVEAYVSQLIALG